MKVTRIGRSDPNNGAPKLATPEDFAVLFDELDPDVVQVPFEDDEVDELNNGFNVTVELFAHWLVGKSVALLVKVMSAHCYT
jgi:hypothetical protein